MPYTLGVRDSIMIAHSFKGEQFGPAQQLHGATYTVDCEFHVDELTTPANWVMDIGEAHQVLSSVLSRYNMKNLDEIPELKGQNTTTEFMCRAIHDGVCAELNKTVHAHLKVTLSESFRAWASYSGAL